MPTLTMEASMNRTSTSRTDAQGAPDAKAARPRILVWDAPVRIFHWLMVLCFAGAYLTAENDSLRLVHVTLGYTMGGLVAFRLVWGLAGSRYARFSDFIRGPAAIARYLRSLLARRPEHHVGHNPAGALGIITLLGATVLLVATGWATDNQVGGDPTEELHEVVANIMLALVVLHVAAVLASSWLHRENLIGAMLHGHKVGTTDEAIRTPWRGVAAVLLAAVAGFWWWQWHSAPSPRGADRPAAVQHDGAHDD
jgi:cytochrome b